MPNELKRLERDVASLQAQQKIRFSFLFVCFFIFTGFTGDLCSALLDKIPASVFFKTYHWRKLLWIAFWWMGIEFFFRRWRKKQLIKKQIELRQLQAASV